MKKSFYAILLIITFAISCSENPSENNDCPRIDVGIVAQPSYSNPIWHPGGNFIGFNHTPLDSITYPNGMECRGLQHFNYDSSGFWLVNTDGTNMRKILPYQLFLAKWSPDGRCIAFVNNAHIYKMPFIINEEKFDTTQIEQLTFEGKNFLPVWSPDGKWIAFDSNSDSPNGMYFIWKMRNDGTQKIRISYEPDIGEIRMPNWSPDGEHIIHQRYIGVGAPEIYEMDSNGSNSKRLTFNQDTDSYPAYSLRNNIIAYITQFGGRSPQIWLINTTGDDLRQLTANNVDVDFGLPFSWSPDGEKIVYTQYNANDWSYDNGVLWIINVSNSAEYQLTFNIGQK